MINPGCRGEETIVSFLGYRNDIPSLISSSEFVVHCTFLDNLPMIIIETISLKKALICSKVGGIPEMVCEKSLFLNSRYSFIWY